MFIKDLKQRFGKKKKKVDPKNDENKPLENV
jgi:hypothetical protein